MLGRLKAYWRWLERYGRGLSARLVRTEHSSTQNAISIKVVPAGTSEGLVNGTRSPEEERKCSNSIMMNKVRIFSMLKDS